MLETTAATGTAARPLGGLAIGVLVAGVVAALVAAPHAGAAAGSTPTSLPGPAAVGAPAVDALAAALVPVATVAAPDTTTTTAVPAPPAPPPAPVPVTVAPPVPASPPAPVDLQARVEQAFADAVPAAWREGLPTTLRVILGSTSYATGPDLIEVGDGPASGSWSHLLSVVAHEFGHLIAFRYGSGEYVGAAPEGWPDPGFAHPAEAWADCVAQAFTGVVDPSYDLPPCPDATLAWTIRWLAGEG
jgi:hypothetical protein